MESSGGMVSTEAATVAAPEARIEIVGERRRVRDAAFRARVVEECCVPGAWMRDLARRHGICTSLIHRWRRSARPPETAGAAVRPDAAGPIRPMDERPGVIEIDLADGTRPRVDAFVNERALRRVLTVLRTAP